MISNAGRCLFRILWCTSYPRTLEIHPKQWFSRESRIERDSKLWWIEKLFYWYKLTKINSLKGFDAGRCLVLRFCVQNSKKSQKSGVVKNIPHGPHPLHPSPFCIGEVQTFDRWGSDIVEKLPYVQLNAIGYQKSARKIFAIRKPCLEAWVTGQSTVA